MDTFKKIYRALIIMVILSIGFLCLLNLGIIKISYDVNDETAIITQMYMTIISACIIVVSFVFSRAANVIANRKNTIFGYLAVFDGLLLLLLLAVMLIFKISDSGIFKIFGFLLEVLVFLTLLVLVFEIPQANSSHGTFQKMTAILIAITFLFNAFVVNENSLTSYFSNATTSTSTSTNTYYTEDEDSSSDTNVKIQTVLTYSSIAAFLINPMLRVLYIDKDYNEVEEIDEIIKSANNKYGDNNDAPPNSNIPGKEEIKKPIVPEKKKEVPKPIPTPIKAVEEVHEKVINPNFKQEELPEAIIPTINGEEEKNDNVQQETITPPVQEVESQVEPQTEPQVETPSETTSNEEVKTPVEQETQPLAVPEVSTPLDQVTQPVNQPSQEQTPQEVQVSTPLDQVVQPNNQNNQ